MLILWSYSGLDNERREWSVARTRSRGPRAVAECQCHLIGDLQSCLQIPITHM